LFFFNPYHKQCHVKLSSWAKASSAASQALNIASELASSKAAADSGLSVSDQDRCKALFRRGQARVGSKEFEEAVTDLVQAVKLAPEDKLIARELALAQRAIAERAEKEKKAFAKMFA
jgi:peptidyl-prolyl isomerase D